MTVGIVLAFVAGCVAGPLAIVVLLAFYATRLLSKRERLW